MSILLVFGTRPEAIKMAPVIHACQRAGDIDTVVYCTGQHQDMVRPVLEWFDIEPQETFATCWRGMSLNAVTSRLMEGINDAIVLNRPECVVAQGDTQTAMCAAMAAFNRRVPFVHVEAGLRTGDLQSPWPEEFNRRVADMVASVCCAPTLKAHTNLVKEGIGNRRIEVTGNTGIDALLWTVNRSQSTETLHPVLRERDGKPVRVVLVTAHRRESFGEPMERICRAVGELARLYPDVLFAWPVHPNPQVKILVTRCHLPENVQLLPPLPYEQFVWLMARSTIILTDSGGVQEEAPSLRVPVLVMRDTTERKEAIECGAAKLVGTDTVRIIENACQLLESSAARHAMMVDESPFGDGHAAERIVELIRPWG